MIRNELVQRISARSGLTKRDSDIFLESLEAVILEAVKAGEEVGFKNIGKFVIKEAPEQMARNPKTGEMVCVKAHNVVNFKLSKTIRQIVRGKS